MIIHVKQSCEFCNKDGEKFSVRNGDIVVPPEWIASDPYFQLLTNSGLITAHIDNRSVDNQLAKEEKEKKKCK